ncbi:MAG: hypothetical protein RL026_1660 [Pseudomonadota bacterium]|jgi:uncharacterized protein YciI/uncharacterized glyoxalase superfamily protein PhnB
MTDTVFTEARWVLAVTDLARSTAWYQRALGFQLEFAVEGWSFLSRGACRLRLGHCPDLPPMSATPDHSWMLYLEVSGIDALHVACRREAVTFWHDIADRPWGLREFAIITPDGHRIMFGESLATVGVPQRHFLLLYRYGADYLARRGAWRNEHLALARQFLDRGELQLGGAYANPGDGAQLLFRCTDERVPRAFAAADPYVREGLVSDWQVREWTTVVGDQALQPLPVPAT